MMLREEWVGKAVRVVKAANPGLQGIAGKVINETKHLVEIETPERERKKVPKRGTLFAFVVNSREELVDGTLAEVSPEERIKLKAKSNGRNL